MSRTRKAVLAAGLVIVLVIVLVVAAFALLQTGASKRRLAAYISGMLTDRLAWNIQIEGLTGNVPFNMHVDSITIEDAEGRWLEVRDLTIDSVPFGLLGRRVELDEISAEYLEVVRTPIPKEQPDEPWQAPQVPAMPDWLIIHDFHIDELVLGAALLAGEAATFTAEGALVPGTTEGSPIRLTLARTDEDTTRFDLNANLANQELAVELDAVDAAILPRLTGTAGPALIELNGSGPLSDWKATFDASWGDTPLLGGDVTLRLAEDTTIEANADLNLAHPLFPADIGERFGDRAKLTVAASQSQESVLNLERVMVETPQAALELVGTASIAAKTLDLRAAFKHEDAGRLIPLRSEGTPEVLAADLTATGTFTDPELRLLASLAGAQVLNTAVKLNFDDGITWDAKLDFTPTPLLVPEKTIGLLGDEVKAAFTGSYSTDRLLEINAAHIEAAAAELTGNALLNWPDHVLAAEVNADVADLGVFGAFTSQQVTGGASVEIKATGDAAATKFAATMDGKMIAFAEARADGIHLEVTGAAGGWPDHLREDIALTLQGNVEGLQTGERHIPDVQIAADVAATTLDHVVITGVQVKNDTLQFAAQGEVWPDEPRANLDATFGVASVETYAAIFDQSYSGQLQATAQLRSTGVASTSFDVSATWTQPGGLPEPANAILGTEIKLNTQGALEQRTLRIAQLDAEADYLDASLQASYGLDTQKIEAAAMVNASDLAAAGAAADLPLAGSLAVNATANGTPDALTVTAEATGSNLQYQQYNVDDLQLALDAAGLPRQPEGNLRFTLQQGGESVEGNAAVAYAENVVTLPALEVRAGSNRISGDLRYNTETRAASGAFNADMPRLAELQGFIGQQLSGALTAQADLQVEDGQSSLEMQVQAQNLKMPLGAVEEAEIQATVNRLFEAPEGSLNLTATGLEQEILAVSRIQISAQGDAQQADATLHAEGNLEDIAAFGVDVTASASMAEKRLNLQQLAAHLAEYDLALTDPATVEWGENRLDLSTINLAVEQGSLQVAGQVQPATVDLQARWENLPLSVTELFTTQALNGALGGQLTVTGDPARPQVHLQTATEDLRMAFGEQDLPPLSLALNATADGNQANIEGSMQLADAGQASINAALPLNLSLMPWAFDLPPGGALSGQVNTDLELQPIPKLLGLQGHIVQGRLDGRFELGGTISSPSATGAAHLTNARYENATSGTILTDLQATIEAEDRQLRLTQLSASDPTGGKISGEGQLLLDPDQSFPYNARIELTNARVVHRDDVSGNLSGVLTAEGDLQESSATGNLAIGPAVVNIPDLGGERGPAKIQTVDFTSTDAAAAESGEDARADGGASGLTLHLNIDASVPNRIFVRGQGLDSEWRGDVQVSGTADDPRLAGVLTMIKGSLTVFGRRFEFEESTITFDRDAPPSPYLNLRASADAGDVTALLRISGEIDNLDIQISSDPPLPEDEVIARVLFGRDISEISPVQALQLAQYMRMLSGRKSGLGALGALQKLPGLDRLDFRQGAGEGETAVGVGKYLTDDIYIEVEQGLGQGSSRVNVELELTPQITVEGTAGAGGESRAGIFWKKDY